LKRTSSGVGARNRKRHVYLDTYKEASLSILWIILIVVLVLALLGFFSRGAW
jgi:flagellar basal body-associated protein FliL